jgi:adenosylhomocysteine nucleosidase
VSEIFSHETPRIACFIPTKTEARSLLRRLELSSHLVLYPSQFYLGWMNKKNPEVRRPLLLVQTGIGPKAAAQAARYAFAHFNISEAWVFGFAGATQKGTINGEGIIATEIGSYDLPREEWIKTDPLLRKKAVSIFHSAELKVKEGPILTSEQIITSSEKKLRLGEEFNCFAVEMEAYPIAQIAKAHQVPFIEVRWVLDPAEVELPDFSSCIDSSGKARLFALLQKPNLLVTLPRFFVRIQATLRMMNRFLEKWMDGDTP